MKLVIISILLVISFSAMTSSKIVIKLESDTKSLKSNIGKLQKDLLAAEKNLTKIGNALTIPSHAAGELTNLDRTLTTIKELLNVGELVPPIKQKAQELKDSIVKIDPSVKKAQETTQEVANAIEPIRKDINALKKEIKKIYRRTIIFKNKDLTAFFNGIISSSKCVKKTSKSKRSCMQDELNSLADDADSIILESNQDVLNLMLALDKIENKISSINTVLNDIVKITWGVTNLDRSLHRLIAPFSQLRKLMSKHYLVKFTYPDPYNTSKKRWFKIKLSGKDIIKGVHHIVLENKKALNGALLKEAQKIGLQKIAIKFYQTLEKPLKFNLRKLNFKTRINIKHLTKLHELEDSLMGPLRDLKSMLEEAKLDTQKPNIITCKELLKECN